MSFIISEAELKHLDHIEKIEKFCFSLPWDRKLLERHINAENAMLLVATDDTVDAKGDEPVLGYVGLVYVLDEGYLSNLAVAPEYRRRGIASALITELIEKTRAKLSFLTLEVRESNKAGIALYSKHGFEVFGIRKNYYEKPRENALIMTLYL